MRNINSIAFTKKGKCLLEKMNSLMPENNFKLCPDDIELKEWIGLSFEKKQPIVFVCATGIAVRMITPFLKNKLEDPAVIVIDEAGNFVIPIVSGHVGGANELAVSLAKAINAVPVITTATDVNESFAIDSWAKDNSLYIENKDGIKAVSSKVLEGKAITLSIKDYPPTQNVDVIITDRPTDFDKEYAELVLKRRRYVLGIGCKKGKSADDIQCLIDKVFESLGINYSDVYAIATIDIKENEPGIQDISVKNRIPVLSFTPNMLKSVQGEFSSSEFVNNTVGVDNVCERAAVLGAGSMARLILNRQASCGVTIAVAKRFLGAEDN